MARLSRNVLCAFFAAFVATAVIACAGAPPEPATRQVATYTIEDFLGTTSYSGGSFSPDNSKILVSSDASGTFNAYAIPTAGGDPVQLTLSETDSIFVRSYFPEDERFIYSADQGGNELAHIYVQDPDGNVTDLTPGEGHVAQFAGWAVDDQSFFIGTNERDPQLFDLYEYQVADGYPREMIYRNEHGMFPGGVSPDRRYLSFMKPITTNESDVYIYDRESDEMRNITPQDGGVANSPTDFSPDSKSIYYTTNEGSEFAYLVRQDLESGDTETVIQEDWDVMFGGFSKHGKYFLVGINNDARTELRLFAAETMTPIAIPTVPDAEITSVGFSGDESMMVSYASSSRRPSDIYVQAIDDGGEPRRLTDSINPNIDPDDLVDGEVVRFASYDGLEIPGILYKPYSASEDSPAPALVWVHGGPGGQSRIGYSGLLQYLVNHGYVVYAINNRGSSGYGKTFFAADDQKHGEADLGDVVASKQMLIDTGYVDPDHIGIIGGSYGGYMVLAVLSLAPEEFDAGVDLFGISNWIRTLESIPPWWGAQKDALYSEMGNPETDRERLERISPLYNAERIVRPLMVLQGANDPRVLQVESDDIVAAAEANGVPVEYIIFPDEGHGFRKKENQLRGYKAILDFLDTHLQEGEMAREGEAQ
jgi:dipeptidyl aminopeptidase/acylaminoacyl peptidase